MKKRKILNICMVAVVLFTLLCGVMAVGSVKGWFHSQDSNLSVSEKIGIVSVERQGISYELQNRDQIKSGDIVCTNETASINILEGEIPRLALSGNTKISIENNEDEFQVHVIQGEVFSDARGVEKEYTFLLKMKQLRHVVRHYLYQSKKGLRQYMFFQEMYQLLEQKTFQQKLVM